MIDVLCLGVYMIDVNIVFRCLHLSPQQWVCALYDCCVVFRCLHLSPQQWVCALYDCCVVFRCLYLSPPAVGVCFI